MKVPCGLKALEYFPVGEKLLVWFVCLFMQYFYLILAPCWGNQRDTGRENNCGWGNYAWVYFNYKRQL